MSARTKVQQLARESYDRGDPLGWFEQVYQHARGDAGQVPWVGQQPDCNLTSWLSGEYSEAVKNTQASALVVASGLGDDAEALANAGFRVTAFDISETAIGWAKSRFPNSTVQYAIEDLFDLPSDWQNSFDFIFESSTLQALPWKLRSKAIRCIASLLAVGGTVLIVTLGRDEEDDAGQLPWPLTRKELDQFTAEGLEETSFEDLTPENGRRQFVATYRKPKSGNRTP